MSTGQQSFDPDDYIRRDSERDEFRREQQIIDSLRPRNEPRRQEDREERKSRPSRKTTSPSELSRFQQASRSSVDRLAEVVNDPDIILDNEIVKTINDPELVMLSNGNVARLQKQSLGSRFGAQFGTGFGFNLPADKPKRRKRKKNPKLARAMREANARGRKKNGGFKKGYDQARIARLAQKILKRMK